MKLDLKIELKEVSDDDIIFLYDLLEKRNPEENISHTHMPNFEGHREFVLSKPYTNWYIIKKNNEKIGSIYLSKRDEIGVSILDSFEFDEIAKSSFKLLMELNPRKRYLANVSPKNKISQRFLEKNGFVGLEYVYELKNNG